MLRSLRTPPGPLPSGTDLVTLYALLDFLEMRTELPEQQKKSLLAQLAKRLDLSGEIQPMPAFMVGTQAVLCLKEAPPETYWVYNPKKERLHLWKEHSLLSEVLK